jgi:hypothetical protein
VTEREVEALDHRLAAVEVGGPVELGVAPVKPQA